MSDHKEISLCNCGEFYQSHHPGCPARGDYDLKCDAIDHLTAELAQANAREREAFRAGHYSADPQGLCDPDPEHAWQQYRCQES